MGHDFRQKYLALGFGAVIGLAALSGCSSEQPPAPAPDVEEPATDGTPATETVQVTLEEFAVGATPSSVAAGEVTFDVTNDGPDDVHEFVVIKTDLGLTDLPVDDDGAVLEEGEGMKVIDEIEDIAVGATESVSVELKSGSYVFICNILQEEPDGTLEAHYSEGMRTSFAVT